jgi:hypothetical protein
MTPMIAEIYGCFGAILIGFSALVANRLALTLLRTDREEPEAPSLVPGLLIVAAAGVVCLIATFL